MVLDVERRATRPIDKEEIALEVRNCKAWTHDPDLLETVADKVKDVRKRAGVIQR
jgi:hypothetical protein